MNNNPVDQWTNAELDRWMAERDGVLRRGNKDDGETDWIFDDGDQELGLPDEYLGTFLPNYPDSLDAVVGWIERRGFRWVRYLSVDCVWVSNGTNWYTCAETSDCQTARALCVAGIKAQMEVEAKNG